MRKSSTDSNRRSHPTLDFGRRIRARDFPRPRRHLRPFDRPGPQPRRINRFTAEWRARDGTVQRRPRRSARHLQPLQGFDFAARVGPRPGRRRIRAERRSFAKGIAQPTFFDLYGFFPGNFVGNPSLKPESSLGFEAAIRLRRGAFDGVADRLSPAPPRRDRRCFRARFPSTAVNRDGISHRSGIEAEFGWHVRRPAAAIGQLRLPPCDRTDVGRRPADDRTPPAQTQRFDRCRRVGWPLALRGLARLCRGAPRCA